jgi:hypothetical protein
MQDHRLWLGRQCESTATPQEIPPANQHHRASELVRPEPLEQFSRLIHRDLREEMVSARFSHISGKIQAKWLI